MPELVEAGARRARPGEQSEAAAWVIRVRIDLRLGEGIEAIVAAAVDAGADFFKARRIAPVADRRTESVPRIFRFADQKRAVAVPELHGRPLRMIGVAR